MDSWTVDLYRLSYLDQLIIIINLLLLLRQRLFSGSQQPMLLKKFDCNYLLGKSACNFHSIYG